MKKFWTSASGSMRIDPEALHSFLNENGFYNFIPETTKEKILVKLNGKRVKQVKPDDLRIYCWNYLEDTYQFTDDEERKQVKGEFMRSGSLFSSRNLILLKEVKFEELKDTKECSYLFFKNCFLEIVAEKIIRKDYTELERYVWEEEIIPHDFTGAFPENYKPEGNFYEFFQDITKNENKTIENQNRDSLITIIGYLLHRFKSQSIPKAVIFMDTYSDGNPNGGTGKGLLSNSLGKIRKMVQQDGKIFQQGDKFTYSNVKYSTRLLKFDDVMKNFNFERLFPVISEDIVVERKFENKMVIPFEESPKVIITTNYTVEGSGSSHKRRKVEFILSDFYKDYKPEDKFGHQFFSEWNSDEWQKFFLFMAYCIQMYLLEGLINPIFNVGERTLKMNASSEFINYANNDLTLGAKYNKREEHEKFLSKYPTQTKVEQNTFTRWLKLYADAYGFNLSETHSGSDNFFELTT
jgi:hypothetical protein